VRLALAVRCRLGERDLPQSDRKGGQPDARRQDCNRAARKRTDEIMVASDAVNNKAFETRTDLPAKRGRAALDFNDGLGLWLADEERVDDPPRVRMTGRKDDDASSDLSHPAVELGLDELDERLGPCALGSKLAADASE
jgi:hypothetical protein